MYGFKKNWTGWHQFNIKINYNKKHEIWIFVQISCPSLANLYFSDEKNEIKLKTKVNDNVKKNVIKGKLKNKNLISKNSKSKVSKNVNTTIKDKSKKLTPKLATSTLIKAKIRNNPTSKITFTPNNDLVPIKQRYYLKDISDWKFPNTLPIYYRIDNEGWDVKSWKDILQITLMHLYQHHYHDKVLIYLKQKDIYLGKYKRTLISPRCIPNTDCWFATNYQTTTIINLCKDLFHYFKEPLNKMYFIIK